MLSYNQIDTASNASRLGVGLRQPREPVAQFVMARAVDHFRLAGLPGHEALRRQQAVERGGRRCGEVHLRSVAAALKGRAEKGTVMRPPDVRQFGMLSSANYRWCCVNGMSCRPLRSMTRTDPIPVPCRWTKAPTSARFNARRIGRLIYFQACDWR
jgi:hypothetical protein